MTILDPLQFYLCVIKPEVAFTGIVSSDPSDPYIAIPFSSGATGTAGMIVEGNTLLIGTSSGERDIGAIRIKGVTGTSSGYVYVAETDDVGPNIQSGHYLTGLREWRLWPKVPRQDATNPDNIIYYEDYDIPYDGQTSIWRPMAVAGPPAVAFLENGVAQADFVGDRSYALAEGASISSQKWTALGSNEITSSSLGTEGSPVSFTYNSAGQYSVELEITDSNGNKKKNYTWVYVIDPDNPAVITKFDDISDNFDRSQGGGTITFTVRGSVTAADFPRNAMVILASRGNLITPTGTWPFRENVQFVGYVVGGTVSQDPFESAVSFQAASITTLMKSLSLYPARLERAGTPVNWTQTGSNMTVARILSFLAHYRSTLSLMASVIEFPYAALIKAQDFGFDSLYGQASKLLRDALGDLVANHQGVIYPEIHYQIMLDSERVSVSTGKSLNKTVWVGSADIQEMPDWSMPVRKVKFSGVHFNGATAVPYFSEAPGDVQSDWGNERAQDSLILSGQDDLNIRSGREFARHHATYPSVRMNFINEGTFQIVPQRLYFITFSAGDNNRGLALSISGIISRIRRTYDHENGIISQNIEFATVQAGITGESVIMPVQAPSLTGGGVSPANNPPPSPVWEEANNFNSLLIVTDIAGGVYKRTG